MMLKSLKSVWALKKMTTSQKIVFLSIADRANKENICWPSIKRIMEDTSIGNKMTVINAIKTLQERGLITAIKTGGRVNHYQVHFDALLSPDTPGTEVHLPQVQKCTWYISEHGTEVHLPPGTEVHLPQVQKCTTKSIKKSPIEEKTSLVVNTDKSAVDSTGDDILKNPQNNSHAKPTECPYGKIVDLYHRILPEHPKVKEISEARKKYIKARWANEVVSRLKKTGKGVGETERLGYMEEYFNIVAKVDFLTGRKSGRNGPFFANIDFLMNESKFIKIIEGFYDNRELQ